MNCLTIWHCVAPEDTRRGRILWWRAGAQMDEALGKTGPALDLGEQFGNPEARQHAVETPRDIVGICVVLPNRVDRQSRLVIRASGSLPAEASKATSRSRRSRVSRCSWRQASNWSGTASPNSPTCRLATNAEGGSRKSSKARKAGCPRPRGLRHEGDPEVPPLRRPPKCDGQ